MLKKRSDLVTVSIGLLLGAAVTVLHAVSPVTYPIFGAWSAAICSLMCLLFILLAGKPTKHSRPVAIRLGLCSGITLALSIAAVALHNVSISGTLPCVFLVASALACELIMLARFYACLVDVSAQYPGD